MTDDEELIERLRRTFHAEAAAITPRPEDQSADRYPAPVRLVQPRPHRPRWPLALVAAAVAAAVSLAAVNWPGGGSSRIGIVKGGPSTTVGRQTSTTVGRVIGPPVTTVVSPPTTAPTPTTLPAPAAAVPRSFAPQAVTFVSPVDGWVLGSVPCSSGSCLSMARTFDAGRTWRSVPAPTATIVDNGSGAKAASVRFANYSDGWVYAVNPTRLWSTHDGGANWHQVGQAAITPTADIMALEAAGGHVYMAVIIPNATTVHVEGSPVQSDAWTDTDTGVPVGAGPVPSAQLVLHGTSGWLLEVDRTVVGGVRLDGAGQRQPWNPPCQTANGAASLAASSASNLEAVCQEGTLGSARNLPPGATTPSVWLFRSTDGGSSFQAVGPAPSGFTPQSVASPSLGTIVAAGSLVQATTPTGVLSASFDGGHTWQTVLQASTVTSWTDLGFTTLAQGVVIGSRPSGPVLYMTRDGGQHWTVVNL